MIKNNSKTFVALFFAALSFISCQKEILQPESELMLEPKLTLSESFLATTAVPTSSTGFALGINGHPFGDAPYLATPATKQIALLKDMSMSWYRINVLTTSDGTISASSSALFSSLQEAAANGSVNLLPMLYTRTFTFTDNANVAYEKGKTLGANFARKYGKYFTYYNLGNDLELDLLKPNTTGRTIGDYDTDRSLRIAAYLRGMDEGIKANDAGAKTIIDAGWLHWGFLTICKNNNVKFDAIGYHWYSDMEAPAAKSPYNIPDITVTLANNFPDKEIWFTEFGYRYKTTSTTNEADQNAFMTSFIAKCKNNPRVKVAIAYELFDEPYKKAHEGNYGLYKWTQTYTMSAKKAVADSFSKLIAAVLPLKDVVLPILQPALVSNLSGSTHNKPQIAKLTLNTLFYTDRDYKITSAPGYLINSTLIKMANDDKTSKLNSIITFRLERASTIYIAYDPRATNLPGWLKSYTKVTDKLGINDPKLASMNLYKKDFAPGMVTLGANMSDSASGALTQYVLMIKEATK